MGVVNAGGILTSDGAMDIVVQDLRKKTWDGEGNDGKWSNPPNWSCNTLPKGSENIVIDATQERDNTVHLETNFQLDTGNLTVLGGIFSVDTGVTLTNLGTIINLVTINIQPGANLFNIGGGVINNNSGDTISNSGNIVLFGVGTELNNNAPGKITIDDGGARYRTNVKL